MVNPRHLMLALVIAAITSMVQPTVAGEETAVVRPAACFDCDSTIGCGDECLVGDGCCSCGQGCRKTCVATVERVTVEKHCWKTEAKEVCVPRVVLPWQEGGSGLTLFDCLKGCGKGGMCGDTCCGDTCCADGCCGAGCCCLRPRCGRVITVCDLKKEKYECEECVCKWEIRRLPPCCNGCCGSGYGAPDCCDPACGDAFSDPDCCAQTTRVPDEVRLASAVTVAEATATEETDPHSEEVASTTWLDRLMIWK